MSREFFVLVTKDLSVVGCPYCSHKPSTNRTSIRDAERNLKYHIQVKHLSILRENQFECKFCGKAFISDYDRAQHIMIFHSRELQGVFSNIPQDPVPLRKKKSTVDKIHVQYDQVLQNIKNDVLTADAVRSAGLPKSTFYKWKPVAEMKIVDANQYKLLEDVHGENLNAFLNSCKITLQDKTYTEMINEMRENGGLL